MTGKKYADIFLEKVDNVANAVRLGFDGLKELLSKYIFVRDIYTRKSIPYINGTRQSYATTSTTSVLEVKFETEVDNVLIHTTENILIDHSTQMLEPILLPAGMTFLMPLRTKAMYIKASTTIGTVYIWGLW